MRTKYRYDRAMGRTVDEDGMPMLNQGERALPPQCPFTISDIQPALQSMTDGKIYDSKSEMRKEYKRAGVEEVGNEKLKPFKKSKEDRAKQRQKIKGALHRAHSQMGFGAP